MWRDDYEIYVTLARIETQLPHVPQGEGDLFGPGLQEVFEAALLAVNTEAWRDRLDPALVAQNLGAWQDALRRAGVR